MKHHVHFDAQCTSAPMVYRVEARSVISYSVKQGLVLEHMDIHSAFINERQKYHNPVFIGEQARTDGSFKHGDPTWILEPNIYGNSFGTYYYLHGLLGYMKNRGYRSNEHDIYLVQLIPHHRRGIIAITVGNFLNAA